ncbi:APC family permease [Latilactobacillus curvatus]|uniref:Amino acid permease family protein n=1 Tax=Latilactobacillus curvatus JCM 1096 = DSM 20019 TaxID=1293592 RepID=A0AAJ0PC46_LATCU|nr:amino acid permease [Latilactobacillus curvatus]KRK91718.1 amino acid permease family protein [Latilactobacillus curvatus JCM 1096 = DSM 20019]MCP8867066.1 amino acid permease [Latilactobacillus curvatus]MCP8870585.1 amino acid permease [Latilactobacillus curvatus]MCT3530461.1 amino acid permease [Latilactobacillus curvatus]MDG2989110.1 amino acid permease [Latilactobacillus curvatus]
MPTEKQALNQTIGFTAALATVMGTVIGAGVFFKADPVTHATGSTGLTMLAWLVGGLITICAGLTAAELAAAIPETGGMMRYIDHTYGSLAAFLLGWAETTVYFPANIAALSIVFATQCINLFSWSAYWQIPIAIIVGLSLTILNFFGSRVGGLFQSFTTVFKLIPLAIIIVFGLIHPGSNAVHVSLFDVTRSNGSGSFLSALGSGVLATLFAYDGWIHVGNIAGELKHPERDLPRSILIGLTGTMVVYLLVSAVFVLVLPINQIAGNPNAASEVARVLFGGVGGKIITIGILISVYGGINGYTMTGMRIPYAMALENRLPFSRQLRSLSKTGAPVVSGLVQISIAIVMMFMGGFNTLTDMLVVVIWIFYILTFIAVFILRKREPELNRPYRTLGYPVIPVIAILGGIFIVVNTLFTQTMLTLIGIGITLLGLPFYYYLKNKYPVV